MWGEERLADAMFIVCSGRLCLGATVGSSLTVQNTALCLLPFLLFYEQGCSSIHADSVGQQGQKSGPFRVARSGGGLVLRVVFM